MKYVLPQVLPISRGAVGEPTHHPGTIKSTTAEVASADRWEMGTKPAGTYNIRLRLPSGFTCNHCVMQWIYTTGNNWMGLRPETFINCADVKIQ